MKTLLSLKARMLLMLGMGIPGCSVAQNEVYLKIQSERFKPVEIVVEDFRTDEPSELASAMRDILEKDLEFSGYFRAVPPEVRGRPAAVLLKSSLSFRGSTGNLRCELSETVSKRRILARSLQFPIERFRLAAHRTSDSVIRALIGDEGVACTKIAFVSGGRKSKQVKVMDLDGHDVRQITANDSLNLSPAWSPDGLLLAFTSYALGNPDLFFYSFDGNRAFRMSSSRDLYTSPAWSPDGKAVAYTLTVRGNADIYLMEAAGKVRGRLTNNPAIDCAPSWSPDGREMAFTSDRSGSPQIYLMDADGGNVRRLTFQGSYNDSPSWSPRGDLIAYVSREPDGFQIFTMDINGENNRRLTPGGGNYEDPSWSPDGMHIAYASHSGGRWDIYVMDWDGSDSQRLTSTGGNFAPAWSPRLPLPEDFVER
ncbi:Tol-Pal system beta propeller repeat protein TolB [bacterium]|nr:Tol-Pal system beta propeller repeat protein TolB [bacterium]